MNTQSSKVHLSPDSSYQSCYEVIMSPEKG